MNYNDDIFYNTYEEREEKMSSIGDWFEGLNSFSIESPQMSYFVAQPEIDDVFQLVYEDTPIFLPFKVNQPREEDQMTYVSKKKLKHNPRPSKMKARSELTKNVCFNILQKTVKVLRDGLYESQAAEITALYHIDHEYFILEMIRHKKRLTGPKALRIFLERNDGTSNAFRAFLKWFLEEKYIRLALSSGEMKSLKEYICFKNEELLPMLL